MKRNIFLLLLPPVLFSCASQSAKGSSVSYEYTVDDVATNVYGESAIKEHNYENNGSFDGYKFSYSGQNIEIDSGVIKGLLGNTDTKVTVTNPSGAIASFNVHVANRPYESLHAATESKEGWFTSVKVNAIPSLTSSFANGMDISSSAYLYEQGVRFYNADGVEQSLYYLIKEAGVNWVRMRLWVDPTNPNFLVDGKPATYGGGYCDYEHVLWMAKEATKAGLKYLLDFHYSDFYTDPGHQIIPKKWSKFTTAQEFKTAIYSYTKGTLTDLKKEGCLPSAVQVGNELTQGILTEEPGVDKVGYTGGDPLYTSSSTAASSAISGAIGTQNFHDYVGQALQAVHDVDSSILTMVHFALDFSGVKTLETWFDSLSDLKYDILGLSGYCYWHWATISVLNSCLLELSNHYPNKKICVVEAAYGFTYENADHLSASFSESSSSCKKVSMYDVSVQGQANMIHDVTSAVASLPNGFGVFYWEPAWVIKDGCGWADLRSKNSWANQGLFSYEGKALGSLEVYKQMEGK